MRPWKNAANTCIVVIKGEEVKHFWNPTAKQIAPYTNWDIYYGIASFSARQRIKANAEKIGAFWLDVDFKDFSTAKETALALNKFVQDTGLPKPNWVVHSGNGFHVYWVLSSALTKEEWTPAAKGLKRLCREHGFKADPASTSDAARVLRVPGTFNYKDPARPLKVQTIVDLPDLDPAEVLKCLPKETVKDNTSPPVSNEWATYPTSCADTIAVACAQIGQLRDTKGALSEPLWRAGLSVVFRCHKGGSLIHEWSQGDPRYDAGQTQRKAEGTTGPYTCEAFEELNPGGCAGCKHHGKITSPINLGVAPAEPEVGEDDRISLVGWFKLTDAGIYLDPPDDSPTKVTDNKIWVEEVREKAREDGESNRASLLIQWEDLTGRTRKATLYSTDLYDTKSFVAWLANENLRPLVQEVKLLVTYISQYTKELLRRDKVRTYHERLGWYKDSFVLGPAMVTEEGLKKSLVQSSAPIAKIKEPSTKLKEWSEATRCLDQDHLRKQSFAVLAGFGSPLHSLVGWNSAVISLAGPSGVGKSLAANLALSIYGPCEHLSLASSATHNSVEAQLTRQKDVPFLLDEVTNLSGHKLANFIYTAANGQGKAALTQSREFRSVGTWSLTPFVTSNHPLLDLPMKEIEEAHRRRLVEFYVGANEGVNSEQGAKLAKALDYSGAASVPFLKFVLKNTEVVKELLFSAYQKFQNSLQSAAADRFVLWSFSTAYVGGLIAHRLGLIEFDVEKTMEVAVKTQMENSGSLDSPESYCIQAIAEFINDHRPHMVFWKEQSKFAEDLPSHQAPLVRNHGGGRVSIHGRALSDYMRKQRIPLKVLKQVVQSAPIFEGTNNFSVVSALAPGVPSVRCHRMDLNLLGLGELAEEIELPKKSEEFPKYKQ